MAEHGQTIMRSHPRASGKNLDSMIAAVQACFDCAQACTGCADACLAEDEVKMLLRCIRLNLDCADVCMTTGKMLSRQTEPDMSVVARQLEACIAACRSCGAECDKHAAHMEHCQACAAACHSCEQACQRLAQDAMASARG
jgi:cob(I)alamin adenosyltransferase